MSQTVNYQLDDKGVATVTLSRPEVQNAFDDLMIERLIQIFDEVNNEPRARVMLLKSNAKSFSAGADLAWMERMAGYDFDTNVSDAERMADMFNTLYHMRIPTVAVVNGAAFGGGVGLVAACDFAVGQPSALFCLSEVGLGLAPSVISPFVIECIGVKAFKRAAISGMRISAEQALHWGLLSHLAEEDTLNQSTEKLTQQLLQNGPEAMAATKQLAHDVAYREIGPQTKQHTSHLIASMRGSIEGREGISAFLGKRSAAWKVSL